jgi:hypothetical protein
MNWSDDYRKKAVQLNVYLIEQLNLIESINPSLHSNPSFQNRSHQPDQKLHGVLT